MLFLLTLLIGFDPNSLLSGGWTALLYSCDYGHYKIVKLLLERGANPNAHKGIIHCFWFILLYVDMFSCLMGLCCSKSCNEDMLSECAQLLIDKGARVNCHDRYCIIIWLCMYQLTRLESNTVQLYLLSLMLPCNWPSYYYMYTVRKVLGRNAKHLRFWYSVYIETFDWLKCSDLVKYTCEVWLSFCVFWFWTWNLWNHKYHRIQQLYSTI